jgi:hypothetical protein
LSKVKRLCHANQHIKNLELSYLESDVSIGIQFLLDDVFVMHAIESIQKFSHQLLILPLFIILIHKFCVLFLFGYTSTFISSPLLVFSIVLMTYSPQFANTPAISFPTPLVAPLHLRKKNVMASMLAYLQLTFSKYCQNS